MNVISLFPTAVGMFKYDGKLTQKEKDALINAKQRPNQGNTSSDDRLILESKKFSKLRQFVQQSVDEYFAKIVCPKHDVKLRITQSWLNWTKPGQYHHQHEHPNSLISGVFYVQADAETDKIYFFNKKYRQINIPPAEYNLFNSESWWLPVGEGDLVLFPSSLTHEVAVVGGNHTRLSLAFNTFPVGYVGDDDTLTGLRV